MERLEPRGDDFYRRLGEALGLSPEETEDLEKAAKYPRFIKPSSLPIIEIHSKEPSSPEIKDAIDQSTAELYQPSVDSFSNN